MRAGSGQDARLKGELAAVDTELCLGIDGQRILCAGRIKDFEKAKSGAVGDGKIGWDQIGIARRVRVDMQSGRDAEVKRDRCALAGGNRDPIGREELDGGG
jgi:hypothetical protein